MADITVSYKGATITEMSESGTTTLGTSGKYCEDDISLAYVKPSGSSFVKIAEQEFTVNTNNTSAVQVGSITIDPASDVFTSAYYIFVTIRDKVGKRAGYFLGTDSLYANPNAANGSTTYISNAGRLIYSYTSDNKFADTSGSYGIYPSAISSNGVVSIYSRYHSNYSLTINSTYVVEVWALTYAPNTNPFA